RGASLLARRSVVARHLRRHRRRPRFAHRGEVAIAAAVVKRVGAWLHLRLRTATGAIDRTMAVAITMTVTTPGAKAEMQLRTLLAIAVMSRGGRNRRPGNHRRRFGRRRGDDGGRGLRHNLRFYRCDNSISRRPV